MAQLSPARHCYVEVFPDNNQNAGSRNSNLVPDGNHAAPSIVLSESDTPFKSGPKNKIIRGPDMRTSDSRSSLNPPSSVTDVPSQGTPSLMNGMAREKKFSESPVTSPMVSVHSDNVLGHTKGPNDKSQIQALMVKERQLEQVRRDIIRRRVDLHSQRTLYRGQRSRTRDIVAQCLRAARALRENPNDIDAITTFEDALQTLELGQDQMGPLEERYDELETALDRWDYEYAQMESSFINELQEVFNGMDDVPLPDETPPLNFEPTPEPEIHPLLMRYYDKVGDIGIYEDRIREFLQDFDMNMRGANFDTVLGELNQFHQEWESMRRDLHFARTAANQLLQTCRAQGLEPDPEAIVPAADVLEAAEELCLRKYPSFFQLPYDDAGSPGHSLSQHENTRDKINRWLLHSLRVSEYEANRLRSYLPRELAGMDDRQWAGLVWKYWPRDTFAQNSSLSLASSSGSRSQVCYSASSHGGGSDWDRIERTAPHRQRLQRGRQLGVTSSKGNSGLSSSIGLRPRSADW